MRRALLPWLLPLAMFLGLLIAATGSPIVYGAVLIVLGWGVLPVALAHLRDSGRWPQSLQRRSQASSRRFLGF